MSLNWTGYRCSRCGESYSMDFESYVCSRDGGNLDLVLDLEKIRERTSPAALMASQDRSIWRYLPLLPVDEPGATGTPLRDVGWTPLYSAPAMRSHLGLGNLWIKDDGRNPTASFKDRASALVVVRAREIEAKVVVTASTGNAGAALAGMAAAAGQRAVILAPATAPPAKVAQLMVFGANVFLVDGTYDQAFDLSVQAAHQFGWYCRNTGYNAFTAQGKKSVAFEICEQLAIANAARSPERWQAPDVVVVSVGDGNIISGVYQGFVDLIELGWIEHLPRLIGVQAKGSSAIYDAWNAGSDDIEPVSAHTLADSIAVDLPRDGFRALRAVRETGGAFVAVEDEQILEAIAELARTAAVFAEPAGAAAHAGLKAALREQLVSPEECIIELVTGSGIKDVQSAMRATGEPTIIQPNMESLAEALHQADLGDS